MATYKINCLVSLHFDQNFDFFSIHFDFHFSQHIVFQIYIHQENSLIQLVIFLLINLYLKTRLISTSQKIKKDLTVHHYSSTFSCQNLHTPTSLIMLILVLKAKHKIPILITERTSLKRCVLYR